MEQRKKTATYKVTSDSGGFVFRFFCDSSGKLCRMDPDKTRALARRLRAWLAEGEAPKTTGLWAGSHHA